MKIRIAIKKIANSIRKGDLYVPRNCYRLLYQRRKNYYKNLAKRSNGWVKAFYIHKYCSEIELHSDVGEQIDRIACHVISKNIIKYK